MRIKYFTAVSTTRVHTGNTIQVTGRAGHTRHLLRPSDNVLTNNKNFPLPPKGQHFLPAEVEEQPSILGQGPLGVKQLESLYPM